jgi:hypothetical protein
MASSDYNDSCYEAWQRGIRAQCEKHDLIYPHEQTDYMAYAEFDGFVYDYTKITDNDDSFIGQYEDRYGAFNAANFEVDTALITPFTYPSPVTSIFTSQSTPLTTIIAENYHSMCLTDVHRQLKIAVRKYIQRMHTFAAVQDFFQWAADAGRLRVTRQQITLTLPDYDSPEDAEYDYEVVMDVAPVEVVDTNDPVVVTINLLLTAGDVNEIPLCHLPADLQINGNIYISVSIARHHLIIDE